MGYGFNEEHKLKIQRRKSEHHTQLKKTEKGHGQVRRWG